MAATADDRMLQTTQAELVSSRGRASCRAQKLMRPSWETCKAACPPALPLPLRMRMLGASATEGLTKVLAGSAAGAWGMLSVPIGCGTMVDPSARAGTRATRSLGFRSARVAGTEKATAAGASATVAASPKDGGTRMSSHTKRGKLRFAPAQICGLAAPQWATWTWVRC